MTLKTLDLKVEPFEYFLKNTASDSNTVLVLLSEAVFRKTSSTQYYFGNNFENMTLKTLDWKVEPFECFFETTQLLTVIRFWYYSQKQSI